MLVSISIAVRFGTPLLGRLSPAGRWQCGKGQTGGRGMRPPSMSQSGGHEPAPAGRSGTGSDFPWGRGRREVERCIPRDGEDLSAYQLAPCLKHQITSTTYSPNNGGSQGALKNEPFVNIVIQNANLGEPGKSLPTLGIALRGAIGTGTCLSTSCGQTGIRVLPVTWAKER